MGKLTLVVAGVVGISLGLWVGYALLATAVGITAGEMVSLALFGVETVYGEDE